MTIFEPFDLPPDPDLDALPARLAEHDGALFVRVRDPETGTEHVAPISADDLAPAFADARRLREP